MRNPKRERAKSARSVDPMFVWIEQNLEPPKEMVFKPKNYLNTLDIYYKLLLFRFFFL